MFRRLKSLSITKKVAGGLLLFVAVIAVLGSGSQPQPSKPTLQLNEQKSAGQVQGDATNAPPAPKITTATVTETKAVPYQSVTQNDAGLPKGQSRLLQAGVAGTETLTYKITFTDGQQTDKQLVNKTVTTAPISQVIADGTYVYVAPPPTPKPVPKPAPKPGCYPLTNGGNCYEPGEYCRNSDHGAVGVAGDGKSIICADNNGWRWEPR
jgi:hypothetical protein